MRLYCGVSIVFKRNITQHFYSKPGATAARRARHSLPPRYARVSVTIQVYYNISKHVLIMKIIIVVKRANKQYTYIDQVVAKR